jgi:formiminotetrahydrofolate cyclodeaminase
MIASLDDLVKQTRAQQAILKTLKEKDLAAFNAMMVELKVPAVTP